jgi:hypothetical protein
VAHPVDGTANWCSHGGLVFTMAMGEGLFCLTVKEISTHQYLKKNILQYKFLCYLLEPPIEIWLIFFIFFFEFWLLKIPQKT